MKQWWLVTLVAACAHSAAPRPAQTEDPKALVDQGTAAFEAGKLDEAERAFSRAAQLGSDDGWHGVVWVHAYRGDERGMWEAFEHVSIRTPLERAWKLFAFGKFDEALAMDDKAIAATTKADPEPWVKAPMLRGGILIAAGRFADALEPLATARTRVTEAGLADNPYFRAVPLALYAWAAARAGNAHAAEAAEAVAGLETIDKANPGDRILGIFLPIARGEQALGKGDAAAAEQVLAVCPPEATCLDALAEAQDARGEHDAAAATRAKIRTLYKMSPPALLYWRKNQSR